MTPRHRLHVLGALLAATLLGTATAQAQSFPTKPINMVVPYPAGGPSDHNARQVQPLASQFLGQNIIVENIGGASGSIGVSRALAAPADGHTVILGSPMELILTPLAIQGVRYKTEDLKMVAHLTSNKIILAVRGNLGVGDVSQLMALAKKSAHKPLSYGSVGNGSLYHLIGEKFSQDARIPLVHVPYRGIAPLMNDLLGGQIDMAFLPMAGTIMQSVAEGKIRGLGVTSKVPHPVFGQYPALAAMPGLEGMEFGIWAGVQVHKDTPEAVVQRLNQAFYTALQSPEVRKSFEASGNQVMGPSSPAELTRLFQKETERYRAIAKSINLQAQAGQ
ncbi:tripartite tricarboxylate transporter substrate binding protein [Aquabacterium sp. A08]|uniref:Bug family tripartite tricarboxylate transporter substrate binding protein n=1 Tax=Aquabacterium sp. A08 TaxID=2718532 RepID=UPI00141DE780|nr:tripartite tricarboxylate transporter substrate binding protein [Aquabacterium sp. A08]NIC42882.1 tripartite tricarboxylate transporter substrate binding protein [Aquabacterium sp. A08]